MKRYLIFVWGMICHLLISSFGKFFGFYGWFNDITVKDLATISMVFVLLGMIIMKER